MTGPERAVEFVDVRKSFGATKAVDGLSFDVGRGEMFGLIGPDGAGKTTTPAIDRAGCSRRTPGASTMLGVDPFRDRRTATAAIGYLSQRFSLYGDLSIDENIAFFAEIHGVRDFARARDAAARDDAADAVPRSGSPIGCRAA